MTPADRGVSTRAPLLAEERRLLIAAMGRARSRLLVTAVDSDSGDESMLPSPFCYELAALATDPDPEPAVPSRRRGCWRRRRWSGGCARWCAPRAATSTTACVPARQRNWRGSPPAGRAGADPGQWYGLTPLSTDEPLWCGDDHIVTLSPSTLQMLTDCPLRWLLERHGGTDGRDVRSAVGSLLHALVADPGKTESQMLNELEKVWEKCRSIPSGIRTTSWHRHRAMLSTFAQWRAQSRHELTEVGTEIDVDGVVGPATTAPGFACAGAWTGWNATARAGWWSSTSRPARARSPRTTPSDTPSWRCTSWPLPKGCCRRGEPGGGLLVYLGKTSAGRATEREQDALTPESHAAWREMVQRAAAATRGRSSSRASTTAVRIARCGPMCPAQTRAGGQP